MTIIVTFELRVMLDSIRNSCDVFYQPFKHIIYVIYVFWVFGMDFRATYVYYVFYCHVICHTIRFFSVTRRSRSDVVY